VPVETRYAKEVDAKEEAASAASSVRASPNATHPEVRANPLLAVVFIRKLLVEPAATGVPTLPRRVAGRFSSPVSNIVLSFVRYSVRCGIQVHNQKDRLGMVVEERGCTRPQLGMSLQGHPISCFAAHSLCGAAVNGCVWGGEILPLPFLRYRRVKIQGTR
jgi:hypothetical protein